MTFGVVTTGFSQKLYEDIVAEVEAELKDSLGATLNTTATSVLGTIIRVILEQDAEAWEVLQQLYNANNINTATGQSLDFIGTLFGLSRLQDQAAVGTVTFTLSDGVSIPAGTIISVSGFPTIRFQTTANVSSGAGTIDAPVEALEVGNTIVAAGQLSVLESTIPFVVSVANVAAIDDGRLAETDEEFRLRIQQSRSLAGSSTAVSIQSAIAAINSVESVTVLQNRTNNTDSLGIPPHSIEAVVEGADDTETEDAVAQAIYENVAAGIGIYSNDGSQGTATDATSGDTYVIPFTKPTTVTVDFTVNLTTGAGYPGSSAVTVALQEYIDSLNVGDDLIVSKICTFLFQIEGVIDVVSVQWNDGGGLTSTNRTSDFREKLVLGTVSA